MIRAITLVVALLAADCLHAQQSFPYLGNRIRVVSSLAAAKAQRLRHNEPVATLGYAKIGDGGAATYYYDSESEETDDGGFYITPSLGVGRLVLSDRSIANAKQFGCVGDGTTDDTARLTAWASAQCDIHYLPAGVYVVEANDGSNTGITFDAGDDGRKRIYGDGATSVLKRKDASTMALTSPIVWLAGDSGSVYVFEDICTDGNEQNCPVDIDHPDYPYEHEQSANIKWKVGSGVPEHVIFNNCWFRDCLGDGYHANIYTNNLTVTKCYGDGRTRRPRADIQLSRIPHFATNVSDCVFDAFESEATGINASSTNQVNLTNVYCRGAFDIAGTIGGPINLTATNVTAMRTSGVGVPITNFFGCEGTLVNCRLRHIRRIQQANLTFQNCRIITPDSGSGAGTPIQVWLESSYRVRFENCEFESEATSGHYVIAGVATNDESRRIVFKDCRVIDPLTYFATANRNGTMLFDGGELSGSVSAVRLEHGSGNFVTAVRLRNISNWTGTALSFGTISGDTKIYIEGEFDADSLDLVDSERTDSDFSFFGQLTGYTTADPSGTYRGLPGVVLKSGTEEYSYAGAANLAGGSEWLDSTEEDP